MYRLLASLIVIGGVALAGFGLSRALFSDVETSTANTLQAGDLDLKVDNTSYYNGLFNPGTSWTATDLIEGNGPSTDNSYRFFDFNDIKPNDWGEDTISLHVETNDAWGCFEVTLTSNDDMSCTEPEKIDELAIGGVCVEGGFGGGWGDLGFAVETVFWADDGDNVLEEDEVPDIIAQGTVSDVFPTLSGALADSAGGVLGLAGEPMGGETTYYIAKAWCFGDLALDPVAADAGVDPTVASGITCDGSNLNNATQTDTLTADIEFSVVQARNNPDFLCGDITPTPEISPSVTPTATPTPVACIDDADVMLVLDRSGSISSPELTSLKDAAKAFVDSLSPSVLGAHVGQSSFATAASLDHHLSDDGTSVKSAIDALVASGFTNLVGGLNEASTELSNPGDGHDRADATSPDYYVLITDGNPNRPLPEANARALAQAAATAIKAGGGTIYVVGVGSDVDATYLEDIATSDDHYFPVAEYEDLSAALEQIVTACN